MRAMWQATAAPWLQAAGLAEGVFASRMLRFWGVGESNLAEQMADLLEGSNPTVAPYAGAGEVSGVGIKHAVMTLVTDGQHQVF